MIGLLRTADLRGDRSKTEDVGEETAHRVLRLHGKGDKARPRPTAARCCEGDRTLRRGENVRDHFRGPRETLEYTGLPLIAASSGAMEHRKP
jgi:hypothetical protein